PVHTSLLSFLSLFSFTDTATTEIYTLSLHDALPISDEDDEQRLGRARADASFWARSGQAAEHRSDIQRRGPTAAVPGCQTDALRSEEHTSELQSRSDLVCRLLLEKKKKKKYNTQQLY